MSRMPPCSPPISSGGRGKNAVWGGGAGGAQGGPPPRGLVSALRFDRVLACKSRHIDLDAPPDTALELLGIEFHPGEAPGGSVVLLFNDAGALRLDVEFLECELADLGSDDLGTSDDAGAEPSGLDA